MIILALEFSSDVRSVALLSAGSDAGCAGVLAFAEEREGRSTRALNLIESVLREASLEREAVGCIAIGLGPGSYTGIRTGIALAQGWSMAAPIRLLGVSSVEAMALKARQSGWGGSLGIAVDAQRGEYYFATFDLSGPGSRGLDPLRITSREEVEAFARQGTVAGPGMDRVVSGGRGLYPDAAAVGEIAAGRSDWISGEQLEPIYLRETAFVKVTPPRAGLR